MTKREYYERLWQAAGDGTFPSISNGNCLYRGDQTAACKQRCAAGLLVPDEEYRRDMEGHDVRAMGNRGLFQTLLPEGLDLDDLRDVQKIHDDCAVEENGWDAAAFRNALACMPCFAGVQRRTA